MFGNFSSTPLLPIFSSKSTLFQRDFFFFLVGSKRKCIRFTKIPPIFHFYQTIPKAIFSLLISISLVYLQLNGLQQENSKSGLTLLRFPKKVAELLKQKRESKELRNEEGGWYECNVYSNFPTIVWILITPKSWSSIRFRNFQIYIPQIKIRFLFMPILLIKPKQVYVQHQKHTFSYSILG